MSGSQTIPAKELASVTPSVISAGGTALDIIGLALTHSRRVPIGTVMAFPSNTAVGSYFGSLSPEKAAADVYFKGFDNSNKKPGSMLFTQYPSAPVNAYLRGGSVAGLTLTQLQAITGVLIVNIDGTVHTSSAINLSTATSFSNAAQMITTALGTTGPAGASFTAAIAGTTMTVSAVASGTLDVGQVITGAGVTAGTTVTAFGTGTGGTGTYTVSPSQTVSSESMTTAYPGVIYDSVSGAFLVGSATTGLTSTISFGTGTAADALKLSQAQGATLSQGAVAGVPGPAMDAVIAKTQNWATFFTLFEPTISDKVAFAAWNNAQNDRFAYLCWDTDPNTALSTDTTSAAYLINLSTDSGTEVYYAPTNKSAMGAFVSGAAASIDFTELQGRITFAFKHQAGLPADVTDDTTSSILKAKGVDFYGAYGTANEDFILLYQGRVTGDFTWMDSYINEIWMNNSFQLAMIELLYNVKSIPYNEPGRALIRAALGDTIRQAGNFGAFQAGVTLSDAQIAEVNQAAGLKIDQSLSQNGYYLQVLDALPIVRKARTSPPCTFWYMDGGSVHQLNLASVEVQ